MSVSSDSERMVHEPGGSELVPSSWLQMELRLLLQSEIEKRLVDQRIDTPGALAVALRIPEPEAKGLSSLEVWPLETQLAALERLVGLEERLVGAGEFIASLWLSAHLTRHQDRFPEAAFWQVETDDISVIFRNSSFETSP